MTPARTSRPGWTARLLLLALCVALMLAPQIRAFPVPQADLVINKATFSLADGQDERVALPHIWPRSAGYGPTQARYELDFTLGDTPQDPVYITVPAVRHHLAGTINGRELIAVGVIETWLDPSGGTARRFRVQEGALKVGVNRIVLTLERRHGAVSGYLSTLYVGGTQMVVRDHWSRAFGTERIRAAAHAMHLVVVIALVTLWSGRRRDPAFGWLLLLSAANFVVAVPNETNLPPAFAFLKPYFVFALPAFSFMAIGLSMAVTGMPVPRWVRVSVLGMPLALVLVAAATGGPRPLLAFTSAAISICAQFTAGFITTRAYLRQGGWEVGLLAIPFFLTAWYGLRDIGVATGIVDGGFLFSGFVRPLTMLIVLVLLMRRLTFSLDEIDRANETLRERLSEREAELAALHEKERQRTAQLVREQERQRLMHDLHDGLSGHLVSIIALSERHEADREQIERAAREALNDLRLVINSLDIGDRDLPLALASFRERLERQLRRMGVQLSWSMENLPEVSGLTPAHALSILRLLQEAVTNALKHGPATRIAIRGEAGDDGAALLVVENDGRNTFGDGKGHGLDNMRRRAERLGGHVKLTPTHAGMRFTFTLPTALPEAAA